MHCDVVLDLVNMRFVIIFFMVIYPVSFMPQFHSIHVRIFRLDKNKYIYTSFFVFFNLFVKRLSRIYIKSINKIAIYYSDANLLFNKIETNTPNMFYNTFI